MGVKKLSKQERLARQNAKAEADAKRKAESQTTFAKLNRKSKVKDTIHKLVELSAQDDSLRRYIKDCTVKVIKKATNWTTENGHSIATKTMRKIKDAATLSAGDGIIDIETVKDVKGYCVIVPTKRAKELIQQGYVMPSYYTVVVGVKFKANDG